MKTKKRIGTEDARNVHIEHTVPIAVLWTALRRQFRTFEYAHQFHAFLINHSVCTALSRKEEKWLGRGGVESFRSPAFDRDGEPVENENIHSDATCALAID